MPTLIPRCGPPAHSPGVDACSAARRQTSRDWVRQHRIPRALRPLAAEGASVVRIPWHDRNFMVPFAEVLHNVWVQLEREVHGRADGGLVGRDAARAGAGSFERFVLVNRLALSLGDDHLAVDDYGVDV